MMRMLLLAALMLVSGISGAFAQSTALPQSPPISPERRALAQEVIALAYPPEARAAMFDDAIGAMSSQMRTALAQSNDSFKDPKVDAIFQKYMKAMQPTMKAALGDYSPKLFDAYALAYARSYDVEELVQIKAFVQTRVGSKFLLQSTKMLNDPDVAAANTAYITAMLDAIKPQQDAMRDELMAHLMQKKPARRKR